MKNILKSIPIFLLSFLFASCLKAGLDDLPTFDDNEITNLSFEYRWIEDVTGNEQLKVVQMKVKNTIDETNGIIDSEITVPLNSADLSIEVREKVSLEELVGYVSVSTASKIAPIGDSPKLGVVADWSGTSFKYKVTAANGDEKTWTINIKSFNK